MDGWMGMPEWVDVADGSQDCRWVEMGGGISHGGHGKKGDMS